MALSNAHHFGIGNANFTNNFFSHPSALSPYPDDILDRARAVEATHTSSTASYATKCNPETRLQVIADIADWVVQGSADEVRAAGPRTLILWFSGPAGAGKTTIMRDVVDRCEAAGLSPLSYFFSKQAGLREERPLVATLVHQLAALDPVLKSIIYSAIRDRPSIFKESLDFQMDKLVVEPIRSSAFQSQVPIPRKIVIAIDGLDECSQDLEREHIINLLRSLANKLPQLVVIVIASRPEFDLRRAFDNPSLSSITKVLKLQKYDGTKDIRVFLCDEFAKIRATHFLRNSIPENWPLEETIVLLLDKSSGNFIYPATVIKWIKNSRQNPVDSLKIILDTSSNNTSNPLAELDALYSLILHPPDTDLALMKRILHCIVLVQDFNMPLPASFFDSFLGLPPNTTVTTLCDLHSVLSIPDSDDDPIEFHHKTLEDYLLDSKRSLDFFQSPYETHLDLAMACSEHGRRWASEPFADEWGSLQYSSLFWRDHLIYCIKNKPDSETLPDIIMNLDPVVFLDFRFAKSYRLYNYGNLRATFHPTLCSKPHCLPLCHRLAYVEKSWTKIEEFGDTYLTGDFKERHKAFSRFASEIGLDEPLDLGGEGDGEDGTGTNNKASRTARFARRVKRWLGRPRSPSRS